MGHLCGLHEEELCQGLWKVLDSQSQYCVNVGNLVWALCQGLWKVLDAQSQYCGNVGNLVLALCQGLWKVLDAQSQYCVNVGNLVCAKTRTTCLTILYVAIDRLANEYLYYAKVMKRFSFISTIMWS